MTTKTPHPTELLPSYALDALEDDERADVEAHLAGCAECRAEVARLTAVADALAESVAPVAPPPAARSRLMARIAADRARADSERREAAVAVTDAITGAPRVSPPAAGARPAAGTWAAGAAGTGAFALAAFMSWQAVTAQREVAALRTEVAQLTAQLRDQTEALNEISPGGQPGQSGSVPPRVSAIQGNGQSAAVTGRLVYQPGGRAAIALLDRLPALQPGRVYQLWLLRGNAPTPAGTFTADAAGRASVVVRAPDRLDSYTGIGLTAEPAPGRPAPTGPILASGSLAAT